MHALIWFVVELELAKEIFVLVPVLFVKLQKVHCRFNDHTILLQKFFQLIQWYEPFFNILNLTSLWVLLANRFFQIEFIHISERLSELRVLEPNRKVLISIHSRPILLPDAFLVNFLEDGVPVRNGRNKDAVDQEVRKY